MTELVKTNSRWFITHCLRLWQLVIYVVYLNRPNPPVLCSAVVVGSTARWLLLLRQYFTNATQVPYFSPDGHTHGYTSRHRARHGVSALCQGCALWEESGLIRGRSRACRWCLIQPGLQSALARFISLWLACQNNFLHRMENSAQLFIFLCIQTELFVLFINMKSHFSLT